MQCGVKFLQPKIQTNNTYNINLHIFYDVLILCGLFQHIQSKYTFTKNIATAMKIIHIKHVHCTRKCIILIYSEYIKETVLLFHFRLDWDLVIHRIIVEGESRKGDVENQLVTTILPTLSHGFRTRDTHILSLHLWSTCYTAWIVPF